MCDYMVRVYTITTSYYTICAISTGFLILPSISTRNSNPIVSLFSNTACRVFLLTFYSIVSSRAKLASSQEHTFRIVSKPLPYEYCYSLPIRLTFYCDVTG